MRVYELKAGQVFRINAKRYELLKPASAASAYVKELGSERHGSVTKYGETIEFVAGARKYTIAPNAEVDEVIS